MNYYPHHIGDYAKDTAHLSLLQHGAYRLILDHVYATEQQLTVDKAQHYRICRATTSAERAAVDYVVAAFFPAGVNKRAIEEIAKSKDKSKKASIASALRWQSERNANA